MSRFIPIHLNSPQLNYIKPQILLLPIKRRGQDCSVHFLHLAVVEAHSTLKLSKYPVKFLAHVKQTLPVKVIFSSVDVTAEQTTPICSTKQVNSPATCQAGNLLLKSQKHSKKSLSFTSIVQIPENNEDIAHNHYKKTQYTDSNSITAL